MYTEKKGTLRNQRGFRELKPDSFVEYLFFQCIIAGRTFLPKSCMYNVAKSPAQYIYLKTNKNINIKSL